MHINTLQYNLHWITLYIYTQTQTNKLFRGYMITLTNMRSWALFLVGLIKLFFRKNLLMTFIWDTHSEQTEQLATINYSRRRAYCSPSVLRSYFFKEESSFKFNLETTLTITELFNYRISCVYWYLYRYVYLFTVENILLF